MRRQLMGWLDPVARCTRGASALEFALFAPILCMALLAMVDIGMAVGTRMELDRNVRAGAQAAITLDNPGPSIRAIVQAAADDPELEVDVDLSCSCAGEGIECSSFCETSDGQEEPSAFYTIRAERLHSGPLFEERIIASATRVQVR